MGIELPGQGNDALRKKAFDFKKWAYRVQAFQASSALKASSGDKLPRPVCTT